MFSCMFAMTSVLITVYANVFGSLFFNRDLVIDHVTLHVFMSSSRDISRCDRVCR